LRGKGAGRGGISGEDGGGKKEGFERWGLEMGNCG
jgi:hypothetical protein